MEKEPVGKGKGKVVRLLSNINDKTSRPWTTHVTVLEKGLIRDSRYTTNKYQRFVVSDEEGTKCQLTPFGSLINMFSDRLELAKKYSISNAYVKPVLEKKYQIGNYPFQLMLHKACVVEELILDSQGENSGYTFTDVDDFHKFRDGKIKIDALVVVIGSLPKRQINFKQGSESVDIQEFVVIDKSLKPVVLTLWESFAEDAGQIASIVKEKPIVGCMRMVVNQYNGLSISSQSTAAFLINPTIPDALKLRTWLIDNNSKVDALANNVNLKLLAQSFGKDVTNEITSVQDVLRQTSRRLFYVNGTIKINNFGQPFYYDCCNLCSASTSAEYNTTYKCNNCKDLNATCVPRLYVEALLVDPTGSIQVKLFGGQAEQFIGCTALTLMNNFLEETPKDIPSLLNLSEEREMVFEVKASWSTFNGTRTRNFIAAISDQTAQNLDLGNVMQPATPPGDNLDDNSVGPGIAITTAKKVSNEDDDEEFNQLMKGPPGIKKPSAKEKLSDAIKETDTPAAKRRLVFKY